MLGKHSSKVGTIEEFTNKKVYVLLDNFHKKKIFWPRQLHEVIPDHEGNVISDAEEESPTTVEFLSQQEWIEMALTDHPEIKEKLWEIGSVLKQYEVDSHSRELQQFLLLHICETL